MDVFVFNNNPFCEGRGADAARICDYFRLNGWHLLDRPEPADVIVVFTCATNGTTQDYYIDVVKRFVRGNYRGEIIVVGCLPVIAPEQLAEVFAGTSISTSALDAIDGLFPEFAMRFADTPDSNRCHFSSFSPLEIIDGANFTGPNLRPSFPHRIRRAERLLKRGLRSVRDWLARNPAPNLLTDSPDYRRKEPHRLIRIGSGCTGNCAYCGIKSAIGRLKSKPMDVCLSEYGMLLDQGQRLYEIGSEDTGAYGYDIGSSLPELLARLSRIGQGHRVYWYLPSLSPWWLGKFKTDLLPYVRKGIISHLECPIQSGSRRILRLMKRSPEVEDMVGTLTRFKEANPDIQLITHLIVGFPSETDDDFEKTLSVLERVDFQGIIINRYTDHGMAPASRMDGKVDAETVEKRYAAVWRFMEQRGIPFSRLNESIFAP